MQSSGFDLCFCINCRLYKFSATWDEMMHEWVNHCVMQRQRSRAYAMKYFLWQSLPSAYWLRGKICGCLSGAYTQGTGRVGEWIICDKCRQQHSKTYSNYENWVIISVIMVRHGYIMLCLADSMPPRLYTFCRFHLFINAGCRHTSSFPMICLFRLGARTLGTLNF